MKPLYRNGLMSLFAVAFMAPMCIIGYVNSRPLDIQPESFPTVEAPRYPVINLPEMVIVGHKMSEMDDAEEPVTNLKPKGAAFKGPAERSAPEALVCQAPRALLQGRGEVTICSGVTGGAAN